MSELSLAAPNSSAGVPGNMPGKDGKATGDSPRPLPFLLGLAAVVPAALPLWRTEVPAVHPCITHVKLALGRQCLGVN